MSENPYRIESTLVITDRDNDIYKCNASPKTQENSLIESPYHQNIEEPSVKTGLLNFKFQKHNLFLNRILLKTH